MSEIYVEGIRESVIRKFSEKFEKYPCVNINYDDSPIGDIVNETLKLVGNNIHECIKSMFDLDSYYIEDDIQKDIKSDLHKWINDMGYDE